MQSLFLAVGALLLLDLVVRVIVAFVIARQFDRRRRLRAPRFRPSSSATFFSTLTADGIRLHGSILRSAGEAPRGVVIFCHEFSGQRWSYQNCCRDGAIDGFDLVTFDFSGLGDSEPRPGYEPCHWITRHEVTDVEAMIAYVRGQSRWKGLPIILMGASRGANAALATAAGCSAVAGVVAIGAFSTQELAMRYLLRGIVQTFPAAMAYPRWHIRGTLRMAIAWSALRRRCGYVELNRCVTRLRNRPVLLISGDADHHIPIDVAQDLATALGSSANHWIVAGGDHNRERDAAPDEFDRRLKAFLNSCAPVEVVEELAHAA